jgi:hypothetical protein
VPEADVRLDRDDGSKYGDRVHFISRQFHSDVVKNYFCFLHISAPEIG